MYGISQIAEDGVKKGIRIIAGTVGAGVILGIILAIIALLATGCGGAREAGLQKALDETRFALHQEVIKEAPRDEEECSYALRIKASQDVCGEAAILAFRKCLEEGREWRKALMEKSGYLKP